MPSVRTDWSLHPPSGCTSCNSGLLTRNCPSKPGDRLPCIPKRPICLDSSTRSFLSIQPNPPSPPGFSVGVYRDAILATIAPNPLNPVLQCYYNALSTLTQSSYSRIRPTIARTRFGEARAQQDAWRGSDGRIGGHTRATASQVPQGAPAEGHRGPSDRPGPTGLPGVKWHSHCDAGSSAHSARRKPGR